MKVLRGTSSSICMSVGGSTDSGDKIVREAILVHAGDNGSEIVFQSGDGEIKFDAERIKRIVENQNSMLAKLAEQYGGADKMPVGAHPPILDQHESDSNNRIVGRMLSPLKFEVRDVPKVGKNVPCAVTELTFIGEDTVKRVNDGRIFHLSIGIDEASDTLGEVSTVIEPAAPGASLLSKTAGRMKPKKGDSKMSKKVKLLAAHKARLAILRDASETLTTLSKEMKGSTDLIKLTKRQGEVTHRLNAVMKAGRLTPAEYKKLDVKKLAKLDDESLNTVLESYEVREPVIQPHQKGSKEAIDFATLGKSMKKKQLRALESETVADLMRASGGKVKLKAGSHLAHAENPKDKEMSGPHEEEVHPGHDPAGTPESEGDADMKAKLKGHLEAMGKHLADGKVEDAKKEHELASKCMDDKKLAFGAGDVKSEDYQKGMSALEGKIDELGTQLARVAGAVSDLLKVEVEEGHELEAEEDVEQGHEEGA